MAGVKDQQMKEITERLEQGVKEMFTSEMYTKYLQTMSQFHRYSFNNTLLIAMQKPEATLVAGYQAWQKKFKRQVKRGEKGIQIIAPTPIREKEVVEKVDPVTNELVIGADGRPETEEVENIIPRFRVTTVFDVSQTYGEPLPQLETPELMGNVENYEVFLQALREISPYEIQFEEIEDGAKGRCRHTDREIIIQQDMSESQTMKTAVHEVAHAKLHNQDVMEELGETKDRTTKEVEAESVAYTVCQYFGLDTSDYSFPYIAGWSGDKDMKELRTSMDTIRKTAGEFIDSMTEAMQRLMREQQQQHLQDTDLVLEYALPQEEGYCYFVVRRMEKAGLAVQLASYQELYGESHEKELDVFLQEQGAEVIPWFDSNGLQVEYPVSFYDLAFDLTNGITDAEELPAMSYATMLIDRAEYGKTLFEAEDRNLIVNYAYKFGDKEAVKTLVDDMLAALEASDSRLFREVCGKAQAEIDALDERAVADNDSGRVNEKLYLSGKDDRYAIYQIAGGTKGRDYQFMGMDFINSHNMTVDAADYRFIYGGRLSEQDTLDSLYERFNINHPADYTGHSLSVSDVVVIQRDGETKAYFVDSIGYAELPDFIPRRLHEAEMNRKREDSAITFDTTDVEIEQHEGLWHPVDKIEIADEIFYLMRHNEYGDSVAAVILSADGELVAQELENGFDRGALEAIREYLADKGIAWEPEMQELGAEEKTYPPVYRESLTYAMEHASADEYLDSRKLTIDCKKAVEAAIKEKFDGMHLADDAVDSVLAEYGSERLSFVLACTVQHKMDDGRFSRDTKAWAEGISVPENTDRGRDMTMDYVVESHPAVLDGFIGMAREKFKGLEQAQDRNDSKVSIARFYVVNDAYGVKAEREYQYFRDLDAALTAYAALPNHLDKQLGMESTENVPSRMSLINCRNGIEELNDIKAVSLSGKWENPETEASLSQAKEFMKERDTEIAYQMGSGYFYIHFLQ